MIGHDEGNVWSAVIGIPIGIAIFLFFWFVVPWLMEKVAEWKGRS